MVTYKQINLNISPLIHTRRRNHKIRSIAIATQKILSHSANKHQKQRHHHRHITLSTSILYCDCINSVRLTSSVLLVRSEGRRSTSNPRCLSSVHFWHITALSAILTTLRLEHTIEEASTHCFVHYYSNSTEFTPPQRVLVAKHQDKIQRHTWFYHQPLSSIKVQDPEHHLLAHLLTNPRSKESTTLDKI